MIQTFHPSNRQFWENEIFKTGQCCKAFDDLRRAITSFLFKAILPTIRWTILSRRSRVSSRRDTSADDLARRFIILAGPCTSAIHGTTIVRASSCGSKTGIRVFRRKCGSRPSSCPSIRLNAWSGPTGSRVRSSRES